MIKRIIIYDKTNFQAYLEENIARYFNQITEMF